ncbi:MAG TPA: NrsF family protein [Candidatus Dormibacteraeota bacterium]|nr:NrsF family protein [Candidatus Dormibacteraeota bacterium]
MSGELKAWVLAAAAAEPSPTRAAVNRRNILISVLAAAGGVGGFVIFALLTSESELVRLGGEIAPHRYLERSVWLVVTTAGGALAVAATAVWFALCRGRSMLGRSRAWLLYGIALIPLALFGWKVSCSLAFGDPMAEWLERPGLKCLALSLLVAAGPLWAFLAARRSAPVYPALNGAAIGVASGACAWVALDLWCPVAFVPHLLLGHVLPLCILAGTGALLGQARLSLRSR